MKTIKLGIIGIFSIAMMLALGCSKPPSISKGGGNSQAPGASDAEAGGLPANALQLFQTNLYETVIDAQCNKCHHKETDQHTTVEQSFAYFTDGNHANYQDSAQSSTVTKVLAGHNCWSGDCITDAQEIQDGIDAWFAAMQAEGWVPPPLTFKGGESSEAAFSAGALHVLDVNPNEYIGAMVANATLANTWETLKQEETPDGAIAMHVQGDPAGNNTNAGNANAGTATFNFEITAAAEYFVWIRTKMADDTQNELFISDGVNTQIDTPLAFDDETEPTGEAWAWRQLLIEDPNDEDLRIPGTMNLAAGPVTITLAQREPGVKVGYVLLTTREDPNLEIFNEQFYDVEMDLPAVEGVSGKIIATIWEKAQGEDQEKIIGVKELRIESDSPVYIKGISPVIDGFAPSDQATYTIVDGTFGGSAVRSEQIIRTGGSTSTTWRGDFQAGKLKLGFEEIRAAQ